jgi:hypothetical protein
MPNSQTDPPTLKPASVHEDNKAKKVQLKLLDDSAETIGWFS